MNSIAVVGSSPAVAGTSVPVLRVFLVEARMECLRLLRSPSFAVPIILFPVMFYALFGLVLGNHGHGADPDAGRHMLATFIAFGAIAPGLFGVGITVALDRDRGLLQLKRALPMPPGIYLAAKLITSMVFAAVVSVVLMLLAALVGKVVLELVQWASLFILAVLGVVPFCGLGLMVGTLVKGQAAPAVLNLIYIPMSFLAGIWVPLSALPHALAQWAPVWPAYHLAKLAQSAVGDGGAELLPHVLDLLGMAALFFAVARRGLQKLR
jgi:ABC-2 type transport system permease protein